MSDLIWKSIARTQGYEAFIDGELRYSVLPYESVFMAVGWDGDEMVILAHLDNARSAAGYAEAWHVKFA